GIGTIHLPRRAGNTSGVAWKAEAARLSRSRSTGTEVFPSAEGPPARLVSDSRLAVHASGNPRIGGSRPFLRLGPLRRSLRRQLRRLRAVGQGRYLYQRT